MVFMRHTVHLTDGQIEKLRSGAKKKESTTLTIDPTIRGNFQLYLTQTQINKLKKGSPAKVTLSKTQLTKNGGFIFTIPAILAGIGAAASIASAGSAIARAVNTNKHEKAVEKEEVRHHKALEAPLKKAKTGKGAYLPKKAKEGKGAYLPKKVLV